MASHELGLSVVPWYRGGSRDGGSSAAKGLQLLIEVDGEAVFDRFGIGLPPNDLLGPTHPLLPPADGTAVQLVVQRCGCGAVGCGALTMTIRRDNDVIEWADPADVPDEDRFGPYRFEARAYEATVRAAHDDRPWEDRSERIARLVGYRLAAAPTMQGAQFDWVSGETSDSVIVRCESRRPNPRAGERHVVYEHPLNGSIMARVEPAEITTQHLGQFLIAAEPDVDAVAQLEHAIRDTPLAEWLTPTRPERRPLPTTEAGT